jgi:hypothetical protein
MDPRQFDDIARSLGERRRATRRRALVAVPALILAAAAPGIVRAFDAGIPVPTPAPGQIPCAGAADCPSGLVCIDGICSQLPVGGAASDAPAVETPATGATGALTPTPRAVAPQTAGAEVTAVAEQPAATPAADPTAPAVGGGSLGDGPLPAGIYVGRCGALGAEPAFALVDIGAAQANGDAPTPPAGAPEGAGSDFSTSIVSVGLADLVGTEYAIDVRTDPRDPATSVVCGDIVGTVDPAAENPELVVPLAETNDSGASGVGWLRGDGTRTLATTFITRPGGGQTASSAQPAGAPAPAAPVAAGDALLTLTDVNLRAEPSSDAAVVEILGTGVSLQASGAASNGWVPVLEPANGAEGFVSEEFVEPAP